MNRDFTIFFTSDIHGRDRNSARIFTIYKRERAIAEAEGKTCLFFDAGDSSDRSLDYCGLTKCRAYTHILNAMGYDAQTVGNDIGLVYGLDSLKESLKRLNFPVLGANFRNGENPPLEGLKENMIFYFGPIKIGVFGMSNPWGRAYEPLGLHFPDNVSCAQEQTEKLKEKGAQVIIFLSHMGIQEDIEILFNNDDIDLVIGGHSHTRTPGGVINNSENLIHHCGQYGEYLGRVDITVDSETGKIISKKAFLYPVNDHVEEAPEIISAIEKAREEAAVIGRQFVAAAQRDLDLDYWNECALGNLTADALCRYGNTELALVAAGNLQKPISKGEITRADLNRACFSTANPCVSTMTGSAILESLEKGLDENLNRFYHHGLRGAPIGIPQISGMRVEADLSLKKGNRIKSVEIRGVPLDENKTYRIAHTDLESNKRLGFFPDTGHSLEAIDREIFLGDVIAGHLEESGLVNLTGENRWNFL
ncbi:bifunctional metallophosphatase/5'-nucleotidase [Spirochaeta isovalerica]|uniref:2',3'-cyclic-nucleotide 2'-phosphodiesterase (5'-nucleotidase family) n=1 Tax=Spirochaeta isovalerica TaxID=150 RepID=A0A841RIN6_9SPIO|nr:bifunctional UDP-sugar hydrolase/5'-nucleotidase [Spirochaeta isovalerica]MBB6482388.1 2',3'-cyclic-nucleotide 2'-phosphodiesterase (5'-nucleotidase family) [Spirochaeta isovalerica]